MEPSLSYSFRGTFARSGDSKNAGNFRPTKVSQVGLDLSAKEIWEGGRFVPRSVRHPCEAIRARVDFHLWNTPIAMVEWWEDVIAAGKPLSKGTIEFMLVDSEGNDTTGWRLLRAWPSKYGVSPFCQDASSTMITEYFEFVYEEIIEIKSKASSKTKQGGKWKEASVPKSEGLVAPLGPHTPNPSGLNRGDAFKTVYQALDEHLEWLSQRGADPARLKVLDQTITNNPSLGCKIADTIATKGHEAIPNVQALEKVVTDAGVRIGALGAEPSVFGLDTLAPLPKGAGKLGELLGRLLVTPPTPDKLNSTAENANKLKTNPYAGPVEKPVVVVDPRGNAIPVKTGERLTSSADGKWTQVRGADGKPTGVRVDNGHPASGHSDPRAQVPHVHVPGKTNADGTPWLPLRK